MSLGYREKHRKALELGTSWVSSEEATVQQALAEAGDSLLLIRPFVTLLGKEREWGEP